MAPDVEVAGLLFLLRRRALVYQTVWMRQFRMIFGASARAVEGAEAEGRPRLSLLYGANTLGVVAGRIDVLHAGESWESTDEFSL